MGSTANALNLIKKTADMLGPSYAQFSSEADRLLTRLGQGRFMLAVLGQFKRGKSTLLNALLGIPLLPASVVPLTALPAFLEYGDTLKVSVTFASGDTIENYPDSPEDASDLLHEYATEEGNPQNRLGVTGVRVSVPSPLLGDGLILVDTPGIGSTFTHNTETTLDFLPSCDGALFVLSADPPITEVEVAFLKKALERVSPLIFVLTKKDRLDPEELTQALAFVKEVITKETSLTDFPIFTVDSRSALRAGTDHHRREMSGITSLEKYLRDFARTDKDDALRQSVRHKTLSLLEGLASAVTLELQALQMPVEELKEKLASLDRYLEDMELERQALEDMIRADHKRALERLDEAAETLRRESEQTLRKQIADQLKDLPAHRIESEARSLLKTIVPDYFSRISDNLVREMSHHLSEVLDRREEKVAALIKDVLDTASEIMGVEITLMEMQPVFRAIDRPYWATSKWTSTVYPTPDRLLERFMPDAVRRRRAMQRMEAHIDAVVTRNVEQIRWAVYQAINRTFWSFEHHVDGQFGTAMNATRGAITKALSLREERSMEIRERTDLLSESLERIRAITSGSD